MLRIALLLSVVLLQACSSTRIVTDTLRADAPEPVSHLFLLVVSDRMPARVALENALKDKLEGKGAMATVSHETLIEVPDSRDERIAEVKRVVEASGADSVLLVSLLSTEVVEDYVPARTEAVPVYYNNGLSTGNLYGYGYGYGGFYDVYTSYVYIPGYYDQYSDYRLQSQLFAAGSLEPVWEAESSTIDPPSLESAARGYARAIVGTLSGHGLVAPAN